MDGSDTKQLCSTVRSGTITEVKVTDGGMNFSKEPTLTISSNNGTGGSLAQKLEEKFYSRGQELTGEINLSYSQSQKTKVVSFDQFTSVLEFDEVKVNTKKMILYILK